MSTINMQERFLQVLKEIIPDKSLLANNIADILTLEKASVYRRLRGEIPFTLNETGKIAKEFNISFDKIFLYDKPNTPRVGTMALPLYDQAIQPDYIDVMNFLKKIGTICGTVNSEYGMTCNCVPPVFYLNYEHILRFYIFKWGYRYGIPGYYNSFDKVPQGEKIMEMPREIALKIRCLNSVICLWDSMIIPAIVNDIKYFKSIRLINDESVCLLKQDLLNLLHEVEDTASLGRFKETGSKFELYLSGVNIEATYMYGGSPADWFSIVIIFFVQGAMSFEESTFLKFREWIHYLKRFSTMLSGVCEKERILFFERQREIVESL